MKFQIKRITALDFNMTQEETGVIYDLTKSLKHLEALFKQNDSDLLLFVAECYENFSDFLTEMIATPSEVVNKCSKWFGWK